MNVLFPHTRETLEKARNTYGAENQILVSVEELCELACICAKYPRYDTHEKAVQDLRGRVLEELGDVFNAIDHIQAIFGISDLEAAEAASVKGERVARWLSKSSGMEITTQDREVTQNIIVEHNPPCEECMHRDVDAFDDPCIACMEKPGYPGYSPRKIH